VVDPVAGVGDFDQAAIGYCLLAGVVFGDGQKTFQAPEKEDRVGDLAEELDGVAAFDESQALCQQAFELDRADFRAVLLLLAALLGALVVVEFALDPANAANAADAASAKPSTQSRLAFFPIESPSSVRLLDRRCQHSA